MFGLVQFEASNNSVGTHSGGNAISGGKHLQPKHAGIHHFGNHPIKHFLKRKYVVDNDSVP
jgi:hypothetical protein